MIITFDIDQYVKNVKTNHRMKGFKINIHKDVIIEEINNVLENGCPYCGKQVQPTTNIPDSPDSISLDIKNPFKRKLEPWNVQIICRECNNRKGHLTDSQYRRLLEMTGNNPPVNWFEGLTILNSMNEVCSK